MKLFFKIEKDKNSSSDKKKKNNKKREFVTSSPILQESLKFFREKKNNIGQGLRSL